jgi:flagellar hook-associated protein 1 FlgK
VSGTFSSLSTALSALHYNRIAMDVHSGNVANVGTDGYARRRVVGESVGAPSVPALWSRYDGAGDGVRVGSIDRMVDPLLDARARTEHGEQFLLDGRAEVLLRLESGLGEPGDNGVAAALSAYWSAWHDVANNPGTDAARSQLLARAEALTGALASQGRLVSTEWSDQRVKLDAVATEVNTIAADLASLNDTIAAAKASGTESGTLEDRRDLMTMRLAELTGATSTVAGNGTAEVWIAGAVLVSGNTACAFVVGGAASLGDPVQLSVGGTPVTVTSGSVGAAVSLMDRTLPDYLARLDGFAESLATTVNAQHTQGYDRDGAAGGDFFTGTTAATLRVVVTVPAKVAASAVAGTLDGSNASAIAGLSTVDEGYRRLVTDFGAEVASARRVADNQRVLTDQVDGAREALSGINLDEEMVQMLAHQRAYEAAARVLTTLDSVLDTLINRTGLVR